MSEAEGPRTPSLSGQHPVRGMLRGQERYGFLLVLLFVDIVVLFASPGGKAWAFFTVPFVAATLVLALYTTRVRRRALIAAWIAAFAGVAFAALGALLDATSFVGITYLMMTLLIIVTPALILRRLLGHETVSVQTILGAVCVYLLLGLVFAYVFIGVNGVASQPFLAQGPNDQPQTYVYLSFITMATVGYGDYTPGWSLPRALCVIEGVLGQIFLVTTVARLVGLLGSPAPARPPDTRGEGGGDSS
jgi:hypothetical protein